MEKKESTWEIIRKHMMTGIGYMIPIITGASLFKSLCQTIVAIFGISIAAENAGAVASFFNWVINTSADGFQTMMYPIAAAYIAFSIADRNGLAPGFAAGYLASQGQSGFLGALLGGFAAGYIVKFMVDKWKVGRQWRTLMMFMAYPIIGCGLMFVLMHFVIDPLGGLIMNMFTALINAVGNYGVIPTYIVLAAMMAADCGGPINKAAFAISFGLAATGFPLTPCMMGAMVAPLGFGLAAIIDKFITRKNVLSEELQASGLSSFIMGLFNITEGAIPMVIADMGFMVPVNMLGSAISAVVEHLAGNELYLTTPMGNVLGFFSQPHPISYILCLFTGPLVIALLTLWRQSQLKKKGTAEAE